jgi:WD40 repeat protein
VRWLPDGRGIAVLADTLTSFYVWEFTGGTIPPPPEKPPADPPTEFVGTIRAITISPDGRWLATGCYAKTDEEQPVEVWELVANKPLAALKRRVLGKQPGHGSTLAFSPDGQLLFTVSRTQGPPTTFREGTLFGGMERPGDLAPHSKLAIREVATGAVRCEFQLPAISADSPLLHDAEMLVGTEPGTLITGHQDGKIRIWNWSNKKTVHLFAGHKAETQITSLGAVHGLCLSPDGKLLISSGPHDGIRRWKMTDRQALGSVSPKVESFPVLAISPDSRVLAGGDMYGSIHLWDLATGGERLPGPGHTQPVDAVFASPDGTTALTASGDGTIRSWEISSGKELKRITLQRALNRRVSAFSADGRQLVSSGFAGRFGLNLWDTATGKPMFLDDFVRSSNKRDKQPALLDAYRTDGASFLGPPIHGIAIVGELFSDIEVFDWPSGKLRHNLARLLPKNGGSLWPQSGTSSPDRSLVAILAEDRIAGQLGNNVVGVWDTATGDLVASRITADVDYRHLAFAADGAALIVGGGPPSFILTDNPPPAKPDEALLVLDPVTGDIIRRLIPVAKPDATRAISALAVSADGRQAAAAETGDIVYVYELATGEVRHKFVGHSGMINALAFSANGKRLVSGSSDLNALAWDVGVTACRAAGPMPAGKELDRLWEDLANPSWKVAGTAMATLATHADVGVDILRKRLLNAPRPTVTAQKIDEMVANLDSPKFAEREQASKGLCGLGPDFRDEWRRRAAVAKSAEARGRLTKIVEALAPVRAAAKPLTPEQIRQLRAIEVLEQIGSPTARDHLKALAGGVSGATLTRAAAEALNRLLPP